VARYDEIIGVARGSMEKALRQIVQIIPGLAPKVDGIGDYALQLARQLRIRHGIETKFLVAETTWSSGDSVPEFPARNLTAQSAEEFLKVLEELSPATEAAEILLHLSLYGYEKRGVPFWLAEALERSAQTRRSKIHLCFHELERTKAMPWSSGFWVPPFQRAILRRIAAVGSYRFTNTELHRGRLEAMGVGRVSLILNFSTITEPLVSMPFHERRRDLVIFARASHRRDVYKRGSEVLQLLCRELSIERIVDIGPPIPDGGVSHVGETPVYTCGRLSESDVSEWIGSSLGSFMCYPVPFLTKSSVHAVAAAHGTLNFVYEEGGKALSCPGLESGVDFIPVNPQSTKLNELSLAELSARSFSNYQKRASWAAADTLAENLFGALTAVRRF
jgi:hypothetical protein